MSAYIFCATEPDMGAVWLKPDLPHRLPSFHSFLLSAHKTHVCGPICSASWNPCSLSHKTPPTPTVSGGTRALSDLELRGFEVKLFVTFLSCSCAVLMVWLQTLSCWETSVVRVCCYHGAVLGLLRSAGVWVDGLCPPPAQHQFNPLMNHKRFFGFFFLLMF